MEHFLCIDGVEVSNPNRTLAYVKVHPALRPGSVPEDCGCPAFDPFITGTMEVDLGVDVSDPDEATIGVFGVSVNGTPLASVTMHTRKFTESPCPVSRPALPPLDSFSDEGTESSPLPQGESFPYGTSGDACGFSQVTFTDPTTGLAMTVYLYIDLDSATAGDPGNNAVSLDGISWLPGRQALTGIAYSEVPFTNPADDDAPWYDPGVPESADVLGVWINTWAMSSPHSRDKRDRTWGSSLGSTKLIGRELVISGVVFTTSCAATEYARNWLYEALSGSCAGGPCGLPDGVIYTACDPDDPDSKVRTLKRLGLIEWKPQEEDENFPCCWGLRFEATLATEVPYLYHDEVEVYSGPVVPAEQEAVCNICNPCPPIDQAAALACGCLDVPALVVPEPDNDDCFCLPTMINRISFGMDAPRYWTDATAIIRITAGFDTIDLDAPGIRNLRIRAWPNPVGLDPPIPGGAEGFNCQDPCMEIDVACIPRGATLTIDGTTRRATLTGAGREVSGYPYLSSSSGTRRFQWPEIACYGLMLSIDTDAFESDEKRHTAPDSTIEIEMVARDRG